MILFLCTTLVDFNNYKIKVNFFSKITLQKQMLFFKLIFFFKLIIKTLKFSLNSL